MRLLLILGVAGTVLAGCEKCQLDPSANVNVGVGSSGVHTGVSLGQSCGPVHINVGSGNYYHSRW